MAQKRPKRLPTDFFDRLLSNQTDDQINDLLTSLVDEQITPTAEPELAPVQDDVSSENTQGVHRGGLRRDKIEDSIVTRDEELDEEPIAEDQDSALDELIPRTNYMQKAAQHTEEIPAAPEEARRPEEAAAPQPKKVKLPGVENLEVPPELIEEEITPAASMPEYTVPSVPEAPPEEMNRAPEVAAPERPSIHEADDFLPPEVPEAPPGYDETPVAPPPSVEETAWVPEAPVPVAPAEPEAPSISTEPVAEDMAAAFNVDEAPVETPIEETSAPEITEPVFATMPSHDQLLRARIQARWESPVRKAKIPKLAKPSAPVAVEQPQPDKMAAILGGEEKVRHKFKLTRLHRAALMFLLPAFAAFSLFSWYPMLKGLLISLYDYHPTGVSTFVGLQNYIRAFHDELFWKTLFHAGGFCALILLVGFWVPIILSIFINELRWGKGPLKFVFFLPFLMPAVPAAILWKWIMDQGLGLFNALLSFLPLADPHIGWLTSPKLALFSIVLVYIWKNTGWAILIYTAALGNIDPTLYEEAELDGASLWQKMKYVTLPAMRVVIGVMFLITIINTLQLFTEVYIMTNGGPMNSTEMIATYIYKQAFFYMDIGYASALSMILLLMLLVITLLRLRRLDSNGG